VIGAPGGALRPSSLAPASVSSKRFVETRRRSALSKRFDDVAH